MKLCNVVIKDNDEYVYDINKYINNMITNNHIHDYLLGDNYECNSCRNKIIIALIDAHKNFEYLEEIKQQSKNIKLVPNGIFTKYYFVKYVSYKTSDTINDDEMKSVCDYLGHTITNDGTNHDNLNKIYYDNMEKYIKYHKLI